MSRLEVFADDDPKTPLRTATDHDAIATLLEEIGVRFESWEASHPVHPGDGQEAVLAAYRRDVDRLCAEEGYRAVDVVSVAPDHPQRESLRAKFLDEHTHSDDEVRFFVSGRGLFSLHVRNEVWEILCGRGDLMSIPANTKHWFDMGPQPSFVCIRLFNDAAGWVADYTGSGVARRFHRLEA